MLLASNVGDQLPVMPLFEMEGNVISVPAQLSGICVKSGISFGITVAVTGVLKPVSQAPLEAKTHKVVVEVSVGVYEFPVNNSVPPF